MLILTWFWARWELGSFRQLPHRDALETMRESMLDAPGKVALRRHKQDTASHTQAQVLK